MFDNKSLAGIIYLDMKPGLIIMESDKNLWFLVLWGGQMLEELLGLCFSRSWWQSPAWVLRFSWTSRVQLMLPPLKIKFLQGASDFRLYSVSLRVIQNAFPWNTRQCIRTLWLFLALSGLNPAWPHDSNPFWSYLFLVLALSNTCAYYLPGLMPPLPPWSQTLQPAPALSQIRSLRSWPGFHTVLVSGKDTQQQIKKYSWWISTNTHQVKYPQLPGLPE